MPQYARLVKLWEGVRRANAAPLERDISAVSMDTHTRFSLPRGDVPQVGSCSRAEVVAPSALRRLDCTWQLTELGLAVAQWGGTRGIPAPDPALSRSLLSADHCWLVGPRQGAGGNKACIWDAPDQTTGLHA